MRTLILLLLCIGLAVSEDRLRVCATTADLASLARTVGGEAVDVTAFAKGGDDPHFVEPRPSFVKALSRAEVLIDVGMELEIGWLPALVEQAGKASLRRDGAGRITAASVIRPLGVPTGPIDRSQGDVHAEGNPHFLLDPVNGAKVARLLRERFSALRPAAAATFAANHEAFAGRLADALLGAEAVAALGGAGPALALADEGAALAKLGDLKLVAGGWQGALASRAGTTVVADHDQWPYVAQRFAIEVIGFLEPRPGLPPTSRHLGEVAALMQAKGCRLILVSPFFDRASADVVAKRTGATVVRLAHQVGSLPGTDDYLAWVAHNVAALAAAPGSAP